MRAQLTAALQRCVAGALGAQGAALVLALLEAASVARASGAPWSSGYLACSGLLAPLAAVTGCAVGVGLAVLLPGPIRARVSEWFFPKDEVIRCERSLLLLGAPLAVLLWLLVVARWALWALASELAPSLAGVSVSLAAIVLAGALALVLSSAVGGARPGRARLPSPGLSLVLSASLCAVWLLGCVTLGAPSGAGGALSIWGVLSRDELDLRPLGFLLWMVVGAALTPSPRSRGGAALFAFGAALPLILTVYAAIAGLENTSLALGVERAAPLSSRMLRPLRRLTDRDHDGYSARFGGGDCDDARADRNPGVEDVPDNQIDEDCSGADAKALPVERALPESSEERRGSALAALPSNLNVVLLTIDTLRFDLGYAGNPRPISPELDRLAAESVIFERAYALASYTAKSLPPMLIGRYASETHRGYSHFNRFEKADTFLAERLQAAGVHTVSVQGHWYFFQNYGMERGFDRVNSEASPRAAQAAEGDRSTTSDRLSDAVLAELSRPELDRKPFFLWAHYTDPHAEYVVHPGFDFGSGSRAAYDSEVAFVDHHLGRVLTALREGPLWEKTVVIVTSDHGEAFGEHGMIRHGFELWEELVRVPLLIRVPGLSPRRVATRRSAIDLVPTVLDLFRLPPPALGSSAALSGASLLLDLLMPPGYSPAPRPVLVDMPEGPYNAERRAWIDGDRKLVVSAGRPLGLYDLGADPGEKKDLGADRTSVARAMESFRAFRRGLREINVRPPK